MLSGQGLVWARTPTCCSVQVVWALVLHLSMLSFTVPALQSGTLLANTRASRFYCLYTNSHSVGQQTPRVLLKASPQNSDTEKDDGFFDELMLRLATLQSATDLENTITAYDQEASNGTVTIDLPVVCFDALLPHQRLSGSTADPTFGRFLTELGIGGMFVMISLRKRKLRRCGVIARIQRMDAKQASLVSPTAVDFEILGWRPCQVVGPQSDMVQRVGRWRRCYDPDGEEARLGWGNEPFVDVAQDAVCGGYNAGEILTNVRDGTPDSQWSFNRIDCTKQTSGRSEVDDIAIAAQVDKVSRLLEKWKDLASNEGTYENTNVVASVRRIRGYPGLTVDPSKMLQSILRDIGERPTDPSEFALWGAALINPIPALGVSPEIRGRVLEASFAERRLEILEWGLRRSIRNLEGTDPL